MPRVPVRAASAISTVFSLHLSEYVEHRIEAVRALNAGNLEKFAGAVHKIVIDVELMRDDIRERLSARPELMPIFKRLGELDSLVMQVHSKLRGEVDIDELRVAYRTFEEHNSSFGSLIRGAA